MYPTIFWGDLFRSIRSSRALLQKELATILHTSRQSYSNLETGRAHPKPEQLAVLSYVFDLNLTEYIYKSLPAELQAEMKRFRSEQRRRMLAQQKPAESSQNEDGSEVAEAEAALSADTDHGHAAAGIDGRSADFGESGFKPPEADIPVRPKKKKSRRTPTLIRPNPEQDALDFLLSDPHELVADPGIPYGKKEDS